MERMEFGALVALMFGAALGAQAEDRPLSPEGKVVAKSSNAFAYELYGELRGAQGNVFFSPASLHQALSMTYLGAKGQTATEMQRLLRHDHFVSMGMVEGGLGDLHRSLQRGAPAPAAAPKADAKTGDARGAKGALEGEQAGKAVELSPEMAALLKRLRAAREGKTEPAPAAMSTGNSLTSVNALWPDKRLNLNADFAQRLGRTFNVAVRPQDFARDPQGARRAINAAIANRTNNEIPELLGPNAVDSSTSLVLTNAILFAGSWKTPFDPAKTKPGVWTKAGGATVDGVPFMKTKSTFPYAEVNGVKVVDLPYSDGLSMTILLPPNADALPALENELVAGKLDGLLERLKEQKVTVVLPRFKSSSKFDLGNTLSSMPLTSQARGRPQGIPSAFGPLADFSGITPDGGLRISKVIHQAVVSVDEKGTTASGATAIAGTRGLSFDPELKATHPFVYAIRDQRSGAILFLGRLVDPK